ncbi:myb/SANT-like DNA-binding domain-containing protein 3 [Periplaneta americana]|uniref:myb/SANT-like DNA-binding domain-containing protein 3 n=1 Tax=Periplaneta americana TaxID=6978 RepID=UPI0037E88633
MGDNKKKIDRSPNFKKEEREMLIEIVLSNYKEIIESKKTDAATSASKEKAWRNVASDFNSRNVSRPSRHWKSLKMCYENIKKRTKRAVAHDKIQLHKGEGDSFEKPTVDETGLKLIATLQTQFVPHANPYDDDVDFHPKIISDMQSSGVCISVAKTNKSQDIEGLKEGENVILIEKTQNEAVDISIEQTDDTVLPDISVSVDQHITASTSKPAVEHTISRSPTKKKEDSLLEIKRSFYKRKLECLEEEHKMKIEYFKAEHDVKMNTLELEKEIKELELVEKKRKLGLHNKEN